MSTDPARSDNAFQLGELFLQPPPEHSIRPLWFWNDELTESALSGQIDAMLAQGVSAAYLDCRSGLRPRYLSEEWWRLVKATTVHCEQSGFRLGASDEYNWPAGEARDWTLSGLPSHVLARRPDLRMTELIVSRQDLAPGTHADPTTDPNSFRVLAQISSDGRITEDSLHLMGNRSEKVRGRTRLYDFALSDAVGFDGGLVDLLNPDTTETYIEIVYEEYRARLGELFGSAFFGFFVDHEGDYGKRLAWNSHLARSFETARGYDLRPFLPLLVDEPHGTGIRYRSDYLAVVSGLYSENFFGQLSTWCSTYGVTLTGHTWEEHLHASAAYQGDFFAIQRALQTPGVDSLLEWGQHPRHLIEAASVAHVRRSPLVVENQGVQGVDNFLSPLRAKRTTAALAIWGATDFVPHAFHASQARMEFPEDWFQAQPWWEQFRAYADVAARLGLINSHTRKRAKTLLYHPRETAWAHADPVFDPSRWDYGYSGFDIEHGPSVAFGNELDDVETAYGQCMEAICTSGRNVIVVDSHYVEMSTVEPGVLVLEDDRYSCLVLSTLTTIHRAALRKIVQFAASGGTVVTMGALPTASPEFGADDKVILQLADELRLLPGHLAVCSVKDLIDILDELDPTDLVVTKGDGSTLLHSTRQLADESLVHLLLNRSDSPGSWHIALAASPHTELWQVESGIRKRLDPARNGGLMTVSIELQPWEPAIVVQSSSGALLPTEDTATTAEVSDISVGDWVVSFDPAEIPVPWVRTLLVEGSHDDDPLAVPTESSEWVHERISSDEAAIREWHVVGPYDYGIHEGFDRAHPPEIDPDPGTIYSDGPREWEIYESPDRVVNLNDALGLLAPEWIMERSRTAYAQTYVYSDSAIEAELRVVPESNVKAWVNGELVISVRDDHHGYMEFHDGFALKGQVRLPQGWSSVLLKISQGVRMGGVFGFVARLCDANGQRIPGVFDAVTTNQVPSASNIGRWHRLVVPPGSTSVLLAEGARAATHGVELPVVHGRVPLGEFDSGSELTIYLAPGIQLADELTFQTAPALHRLGSLSSTGAAWHRGRVIYQTSFTLAEASHSRVTIDLGVVGVTARATVNGSFVGERPWPPYVLDVTTAVRLGENELCVEVFNTNSQRRAGLPPSRTFANRIASGIGLLDELEQNGLLGPVTVRAYREA